MMALRVSGVREEALGMDSRMELDAFTRRCRMKTTPIGRRATCFNGRGRKVAADGVRGHCARFVSLRLLARVHEYRQGRTVEKTVAQHESDARAAIDDLREHELVKALKTCSEDFQPSTAYQVTQEGMTVLASLPPRDKQRLDEFLTAPRNSLSDIVSAPTRTAPLTTTNPSGLVLVENLLLKITYDPDKGHFRIRRGDGSVYVSRVTDIEEVSYVSSPYLPSCLMRNGTANFSSNAWQAEKCRKGAASVGSSSIQDATCLLPLY
ncbi:hypothetical protein GQ600_23444 [Phytophthora cactorum]|nr:hypothetical protein GQ600_23444 [Phytophthora cactorum]